MTRSIKKGPYVESSLMEKIKKMKTEGKKVVIKTWKRSSVIIPDFVGITIAVNNQK